MNTSLVNSSRLQVDLSFNRVSDNLLQQFSDQSTKYVLTKADSWENDLRDWIQFIRCDKSLTCPELVRQTASVSLGLQFTDDATIEALNSSWRQKPEKTDVLSFPVIDKDIVLPLDQSVEIGDIVISLTTAEHQAKEQNHHLLKELRWLVSHGLLHLLGWDHQNPQTLKEMLCCQEQLMCINGNLRINEEKQTETIDDEA